MERTDHADISGSRQEVYQRGSIPHGYAFDISTNSAVSLLGEKPAKLRIRRDAGTCLVESRYHLRATPRTQTVRQRAKRAQATDFHKDLTITTWACQ